jgi:purine-binding chemotaxis protein CheW
MAKEVVGSEVVESLQGYAGKYLTFKLGVEEYGLEILKVQEIIGSMEVTRVPRTPEYVRGVINLRGKVIPVIDIRKKFGLEVVDETEKTCVIVVQVAQGDRSVTMSIVVDEVSEVLDIDKGQLEPTPEFGSTINTDFILAMGKVGEKVVMLLGIDKVLSNKEINDVEKIGK